MAVGFAEGESPHLHKVQPRPRLVLHQLPLRPAQRVEDGQPHVRPAQLRDDAAVGRLNHAVHDALGVDHHVDVVVRGAEKVVRLNHLQPLVHQRGAIDGDLAAHAPVGVLQRVLHARSLQILSRPVAEGAARGGKDHAPQTAGGQALDALKDGRVLAVGGQNGDASLGRQGQHEGTACNEGLLVGQADVLAGVDGGHGGAQTSAANNPRDDRDLNAWWSTWLSSPSSAARTASRCCATATMPASPVITEEHRCVSAREHRSLCCARTLRLGPHVRDERLELGNLEGVGYRDEGGPELADLSEAIGLVCRPATRSGRTPAAAGSCH